MARITFLGTGGGRFVVINQLRASGGWVLEMDGEVLHVDPGPGALIRAKEFGVNLKKVTGILVSHAHTDHCTDSEMVVEAMTCGSREKRGVIVGNVNVIKGGVKYRPVFSPYHLKSVERYEILKAGGVTRIGKLEVTATPTSHGEEEGVGFVISGEVKIGYTSDGEYFSGQEKCFEGCNVLLVNCLRPRNDEWPKHMSSEQAAELISKVGPGAAVLKHFGRKMLNGVAEEEAAWIEKETGIRTIAARDGMVLEISNSGVEVSVPGKLKARGSLGKFLK